MSLGTKLISVGSPRIQNRACKSKDGSLTNHRQPLRRRTNNLLPIIRRQIVFTLDLILAAAGAARAGPDVDVGFAVGPVGYCGGRGLVGFG